MVRKAVRKPIIERAATHKERFDELHETLRENTFFRFKSGGPPNELEIVKYCKKLVSPFETAGRNGKGWKTFRAPEAMPENVVDWEIIAARIRKLYDLGVNVEQTAKSNKIVFKE